MDALAGLYIEDFHIIANAPLYTFSEYGSVCTYFKVTHDISQVGQLPSDALIIIPLYTYWSLVPVSKAYFLPYGITTGGVMEFHFPTLSHHPPSPSSYSVFLIMPPPPSYPFPLPPFPHPW